MGLLEPSGSPRLSRDDRRIVLAVSIAAHLCLLAWLVHSPAADFVAPTFLREGKQGSSLSYLYFQGSPEVSRAHLPSKNRLTLSAPIRKSPPKAPVDRTITSDSPRDEAMLLPNERPAGSLYGSLSYGTLSGPDVRPALPVFFPDPVVDGSELPETVGDVIVEVVIDDQGNVTQEKILQGFSPSIDQEVLGAIARWRFRPATKNSVPIASKQDVYYHFPR